MRMALNAALQALAGCAALLRRRQTTTARAGGAPATARRNGGGGKTRRGDGGVRAAWRAARAFCQPLPCVTRMPRVASADYLRTLLIDMEGRRGIILEWTAMAHGAAHDNLAKRTAHQWRTTVVMPLFLVLRCCTPPCQLLPRCALRAPHTLCAHLSTSARAASLPSPGAMPSRRLMPALCLHRSHPPQPSIRHLASASHISVPARLMLPPLSPFGILPRWFLTNCRCVRLGGQRCGGRVWRLGVGKGGWWRTWAVTCGVATA
jgi:hypothetical protein